MDFTLSSSPHSVPYLLLSPSTPTLLSPFALKLRDRTIRRPVSLVARAGFNHWHCEPTRSSSVLNTPVELRSSVGEFLSSVFLNQRSLFEIVVAEELKLLADDRNDAVSRMFVSSGSDEACLHRRIAQLKEQECQIAVEDVMYMLILKKFSEIRVPLVPKLSRCAYNGRLEIGPSKDWELESIHSLEVLQMVREHVSNVIGLKIDYSVADSWKTTEIKRLQIARLYQNSVTYGYFLKSATHRLFLEQCLYQNVSKRKNAVLSRTRCEGSDGEDLKRYMMSYDYAAFRICAKLRSREAADLMEMHRCALFGGVSGEEDELMLTSFSSLKRLILEALAFGCFLWETEEYVNSVYKLSDNL